MRPSVLEVRDVRTDRFRWQLNIIVKSSDGVDKTSYLRIFLMVVINHPHSFYHFCQGLNDNRVDHYSKHHEY